jgi:cytochrome c peroxidase
MPPAMRTPPLGILLLAGAALVACKSDKPAPPGPVSAPAPPAVAPAAPVLDVAQARATFAPLPARFDAPSAPASAAQIALGRMLYFENRLSKGQDLSCASCHRLDGGGVDNEQFSRGHKGQRGGRNAPTVFNAAGQIAQFWDGRAADVEAQAKGPVLNPVEMAMPDQGHVVTVLKSMPAYTLAFEAAFPGEADPVTYDNFGRAVGAFERGLTTPTEFDRFLAGADDALAPPVRDGLARFIATGCTTCHNGPLVGGSMYMKLGMVEPYANAQDQGRFDLTKNEADRMVFKVPSLRNVADTRPYFHDGAVADLPTAIRQMGRLQLGKQLSDDDVASIARFLQALSGAPPPAYIAKPPLPPSGPTTPKPDLT